MTQAVKADASDPVADRAKAIAAAQAILDTKQAALNAAKNDPAIPVPSARDFFEQKKALQDFTTRFEAVRIVFVNVLIGTWQRNLDASKSIDVQTDDNPTPFVDCDTALQMFLDGAI